ncbi:hypothetical protein Vretifemale_1651 [Volvox reticuliferus]|uniref:Uncharacterized protein n=1 Tax=Volvox reticuliferus TaxID=1737510 RepID=A0A8J4C451_9CHLO|nr:hypothetical protein Vretifemale_1651 [Volvox reticuliferus]
MCALFITGGSPCLLWLAHVAVYRVATSTSDHAPRCWSRWTPLGAQVLSLHSLRGIVNLAPLTTMTSLRDLDLSWCICLQPRMMPNLHRLHRLLLRGCEQVDDSLCTALCEGSEPELQELDVAYTRLSDDGLRTLAARCPALRKLAVAQNKDNLWSIGNWTEAGLCEFTRLRPDVQLVAIC